MHRPSLHLAIQHMVCNTTRTSCFSRSHKFSSNRYGGIAIAGNEPDQVHVVGLLRSKGKHQENVHLHDTRLLSAKSGHGDTHSRTTASGVRHRFPSRSKQSGHRRRNPVAAIMLFYKSKRPRAWCTLMTANIPFTAHKPV